MQWILDNWADIALIVGAIHVAALVIVNVTPTPKDDQWVSRIYRWFEILGGVVTELVKERKDDYVEEPE